MALIFASSMTIDLGDQEKRTNTNVRGLRRLMAEVKASGLLEGK